MMLDVKQHTELCTSSPVRMLLPVSIHDKQHIARTRFLKIQIIFEIEQSFESIESNESNESIVTTFSRGKKQFWYKIKETTCALFVLPLNLFFLYHKKKSFFCFAITKQKIVWCMSRLVDVLSSFTYKKNPHSSFIHIIIYILLSFLTSQPL